MPRNETLLAAIRSGTTEHRTRKVERLPEYFKRSSDDRPPCSISDDSDGEIGARNLFANSDGPCPNFPEISKLT